jgi:hypothetical protein
MTPDQQPPASSHQPRPKPVWLKRLAWLVGLWLASILVLGVATFGLKFLMRAVGFHI